MGNIIKLKIVLPSLLFLSLIISCASLKDIREDKFKIYPGFEKNADKYLVTSPYGKPLFGSCRYLFEKAETNDVHEFLVVL